MPSEPGPAIPGARRRHANGERRNHLWHCGEGRWRIKCGELATVVVYVRVPRQ